MAMYLYKSGGSYAYDIWRSLSAVIERALIVEFRNGIVPVFSTLTL